MARTFRLYSLSALCALMDPWEGLVIGTLGGMCGCLGTIALERMRIDDPVSCIPTQAFAGVWGLISVGLFMKKDLVNQYTKESGLFKGGGFRLLGIQLLAVLSVAAWAAISSFILLFAIDKIFGLRMTLEEELRGADKIEHGKRASVPDNVNTIFKLLKLHLFKTAEGSRKGVLPMSIDQSGKIDKNDAEIESS